MNIRYFLSALSDYTLLNASSKIKSAAVFCAPRLFNKIDIRSSAEHVSLIRKTFALNISELAALLDVTRPTVYAWLEGQAPMTEKLNHIKQISRVADALQKLNIKRIDMLVRRPIFDGRSLLDKLKIHEDVQEYFVILKSLANKEEQARQILKGPAKNPRSLSDAASDYSMPLYKD